MTPQSFRKKPVVIEAMQVTRESLADAAEWCNAASYWGGSAPEPAVFIGTLEGEMRADLGDWIIRGVAGEFYPVKPGIFQETYEPA